MLILLAGSKSGSAKSICAVNLACQLANLDSLATDRWQGEYSVVLVDADAEATATRCCSGGNLPVSSLSATSELFVPTLRSCGRRIRVRFM
jgi:cellulose biosynthesis protein BcsQ